MKILWAKSGGLLPLDTGGKIRSFNLATELAQRHEVSLFTFYPMMDPDPHFQLRDRFANIQCVPLQIPERATVQDMLAYAANTISQRPYQICKYCRPEALHKLRRLLSEEHYDAVLCDYLVTAGAMPWDLGIPTAIFTHNVEELLWRRHFLMNRNLLWKAVAWREYRAIARAERHFTDLAAHVITVSDEDRKTFLQFLPENKVTTVPTGVDLQYFQPPDETPAVGNLVFTGSMDWIPNEDAMVFFTNEILPIIQQAVPSVTLSIVGRKPTRKVLALAEKHRAVRVVGAVDDIRPYVHASSVYVVPLRIGGGTRIKIFEAMAMGSAIVSTSVGAEGLPVTDGRNILLADSPAAFAASTIALLKNSAERQRLGRAARSLVETSYSWARVTDVLEHVLTQLVGRNFKKRMS